MPDPREPVSNQVTLLGATEIRKLAETLGVTPTKKLGQNFVIDPNTVRRIVAESQVTPEDVAIEIGPGLGSLTLALLPHVRGLIAVEVDAQLARQLPQTVTKHAPDLANRLTVIHADAMTITELPQAPTHLVANLPYNISVPVVLHFLQQFPSITHALVMVQAEVADRMAAKPGNRIYGVPSVKLAWYADVSKVGSVGRNVFWPAPNVDSGLIRITRRPELHDERLRVSTFALIDAAFGQRRKTLRSSLACVLGSTTQVEEILRQIGIDSGLRGEQLTLQDFLHIAQAVAK